MLSISTSNRPGTGSSSGLLAALLVVLSFPANTSHAGIGVAVSDPSDIEEPAIIAEPPVIDFSATSETGFCHGSEAYSGTTRALLIGSGNVENYLELYGHANDVELLRGVLHDKGIESRAMIDPTLNEMVAAIRELVEEAQCGDTVILHLTGVSLRDVDSSGGLVQPWETAGEETRRLRPFSRIAFPATDAAAPRESMPMSDLGLREIDLASAVIALRNRGAFVLASLDVSYAQSFGLFERIGAQQTWELAAVSSDADMELPRLDRNAGGMAVFYGADQNDTGIELRLPRGDVSRQTHGAFSFSLALAIAASDTTVTIRDLAGTTRETLQGTSPRKIFTASYVSTDPERRIFAPDVASPDASSASRSLDVTIISPELTRGLSITVNEPIMLEGRLETMGGLLSLTIDGRQTDIRGDGYFQVPIPMDPAREALLMIGVFRNSNGQIDTRLAQIPFEYSAAAASAAKSGRRVALIIGNQNYTPESGYSALQTPHDDVEDIARALAEDYGFDTRLDIDGAEKNLVLKDAGRTEILSTLDMLRRNLSENDALLVYYAGHGYYLEEMDEAYWVPTDALAGELFSLIPADDITRQLRMMNARHVLVISDSCYSGGLSRGGNDQNASSAEASETRDSYLNTLVERRSRALLSSGSNEPVWDGGGEGNHSVFAAALIRGLDELSDETFTAEELYTRYLKEAVAGSSEQVPQYQYLQNSGHDGGGFLFFGEAAD